MLVPRLTDCRQALVALLCLPRSLHAEPSGTEGGQLHLATVIGQFDHKAVPMLLSASRLGYSVEMLGLSDARGIPEEGSNTLWGRRLGWKLNCIRKFVNGGAPSDND